MAIRDFNLLRIADIDHSVTLFIRFNIIHARLTAHHLIVFIEISAGQGQTLEGQTGYPPGIIFP